MKMKLFQYWNTRAVPDEVETLMRTWEHDTAFEYWRYHEETAIAYLRYHFGPRELKAFQSCGVPAMQADFFRYCALQAEGGIYVDADTYRGGNLAGLLAEADRGMFMTRETRVANDFLFVREPGDPLFRRFVDQAVENIERRSSQNVWKVTGPWIPTELYKSPGGSVLFEGFSIRPVKDIRGIVCFKHKMDYKNTADDWRCNLDKVRAPSIFKDN